MDLSQLPIFRGMQHKMDWLNQRQKVLAANIANTNTPDYRPSDLAAFSFKDAMSDAAKTTQPKATLAGHVTNATIPGQAGGYKVDNDKSFEVSPDGNAVVLEEQMMKASDTAMDYRTMSNLYGRSVNLLRMALGRGR